VPRPAVGGHQVPVDGHRPGAAARRRGGAAGGRPRRPGRR
jgi:hypothetical protein